MTPEEQLKNSMAAALVLREFKKFLPQYRQIVEYTSMLQKEHYDALIKQGFTPDQALYIVTNQGGDPGYLQRLQKLMEGGDDK